MTAYQLLNLLALYLSPLITLIIFLYNEKRNK